ncbi:hypothetical protein [Nocardioides sp. PD653]|uniref:hypothetical protein n=1 Tax=Nocardioides sp. PD653 TaxID=393303 RepID=UPI0009F07A3E|nr:hypothetical protein [Nocardioides sp. PD653]GAW54772.1 hypothetical protein PD653_2186 [Nocardioides sp. PD653]
MAPDQRHDPRGPVLDGHRPAARRRRTDNHVAQIVGNIEDRRTIYRTNYRRHETLADAIAHGIPVLDHDHFLLAIVAGDQLMTTARQYEDRDEREELLEVAKQLGWRISPAE